MGITTTLMLALFAGDDAAGAKAPTAEEVRFFETSVRPVLVEHCLKCHGDKKQWGNLRLDSREALLRGGDSGPAIVPGKPNESRLVRAVRHEADEVAMPKEGKLTERQIADLAKWVEMEAPYPAAVASSRPSRDPNHWSFKPPESLPLPVIQDAAWSQTPIDHFVLVRLEGEGLSPAPPADKRTLLRRATFDLTGLPPTPEQIESFLGDESPDAYERLVDRLLASPAYGERWGRHWLDVARYADSNGLDENVAHGNAWRYRDYVVAAFNADKPYNRFLLEQLAGDLLPAANDGERQEQLIATGFLAIGPKVLAEVDEAKMQMDIVDEQIDTLGRAILGLTLGCARCHDHKFDPIETADYYGLAGIFKSTRAMENYKKVAKWHENPLPSPESSAVRAEYEANLAAKRQAIEALVAKEKEGSGAEVQAEVKKLRDELAQMEKNPPDLPSAMGVTEDKTVDVAIHIRGNPLKLGEVVPRHVPPVIRGPDAPQMTPQASGRLELAQWMIDSRHPLTGRVLVNRAWRWHFGSGLVPSTDNFGLLGDAPTHPELLDWLARRFADDGWSVKRLHRLMLTSSTWQQGSLPEPKTFERDLENRLLGRMSVRRLEAEEVRDALLAVSGELDSQMGGSLLKIKNRSYFFDHTSKDLTDYTSRRRSLYLPVVRNNVYDLFQLLDYPDAAIPSGDRATTTVAPQALLMLNSDFVMDCAAKLAERVLAEPIRDEERLQRVTRLAYGREASAQDIAANQAFLKHVDSALAGSIPELQARRQRSWSVLCHTLIAANEFVYVK